MGTGGDTGRQLDARGEGHVAVIVCHGMGQQRRYQTVAEIVDVIARRVRATLKPGQSWSDWQTTVRREKLAGDDPDAEIASLQVEWEGNCVRFYDAYWAPAAVEGTTAASVFWWVMRQIQRPFRVLFSPWRSFPTLRREALLRYADDPSYEALLRDYEQFIFDRDPDKAKFKQFVADLPKGKDRAALEKLARRWLRRCRWTEIVRAILLLVVGVSVIATVALLAIALFALLGTLSTFVVPKLPARYASLVADTFGPSYANVASLMALLFGLIGLSGFMRDSLGDVQQFVTYEETDALHERREKILSAAETTFTHVLADDRCSRVVVIAHSLGTAVAYETMLRLRARNQAAHPDEFSNVLMTDPVRLDRIQHFITSGSPIDKIEYFFATFSSSNHTLEEMVDLLRGDVANPPFCWPCCGEPNVRWINFWDGGDLISASLQSVLDPRAPLELVGNVRLATYRLPDFAGSHGGYFGNAEYMRCVKGVVFDNQWSYAANSDEPLPTPAPANRCGLQRAILIILVALVPITTVASLLAALGVFRGALALVSTIAMGLVVAAFLGSIGLHSWRAWRDTWRGAV